MRSSAARLASRAICVPMTRRGSESYATTPM